ncbi:MAG: asparagine synthase-related protein [Pseudomonadota bacterium]
MSGFCGIVAPEGQRFEKETLDAMTEFLRFRGPDAHAVWCEGAAGLGHTLFRTTFESANEVQPCTLDGTAWITADARIDGQAELRRSLRAAGEVAPEGIPDSKLILHAYRAWGQACVKHLIGDFSFAIWDAQRKQLFCARDQLGVKPFFYALLNERLIFSNTLDCVRIHPSVSRKLNDLAIADFLLFQENKDPATSAFADIARLPPAHTLVWSPNPGVPPQVVHYWSFPCTEERIRPANDYVERFTQLLEEAVSDRLRTSRVAIEFSGGMDSPSIAAVAREVLVRRGEAIEFTGQTVVYDRIFRDEERRYAGLAADYLSLPLEFIVADDFQLFEGWDTPGAHSAEPSHQPFPALRSTLSERIGAAARVCLTGWDGDAFLSESMRPRLKSLFNQRDHVQLLLDAVHMSLVQLRTVSFSFGYIKDAVFRSKTGALPRKFPLWINPELVGALALVERWERFQKEKPPANCRRPSGVKGLEIIGDGFFFDFFDTANTRVNVEYVHPLCDIRLVEFCLSLPLVPWVFKKNVLRMAMKNKLPRALLRRPKAGLGGSPMKMLEQASTRALLDQGPEPAAFSTYVDGFKMAPLTQKLDWETTVPYSLRRWLVQLEI